ncbi:hypothetical protein PIB30_075889 [Stylosanthes scabra]|uniref:Uncharacterized protein n=1 Tax=Stylosanthes scabra TaxID=79078 RepID=A0ABU6ZP00_9FABA|nr:hypothetical protein [Stylosanthes scabra]
MANKNRCTLQRFLCGFMQKLGVARSKRVSKLFYKAPVAVISEHTDVDLVVIFHYRRDFSEVRTTELFAKLEDIIASSGRSNPIPPFVYIGGSSSSPPVAPFVPVIPPYVASPSFAADLHREDDDQCDLEDNCTFGELVTEVANNPRTPLGEFRSVSQKGLKRRYVRMKKKMNPSWFLRIVTTTTRIVTAALLPHEYLEVRQAPANCLTIHGKAKLISNILQSDRALPKWHMKCVRLKAPTLKKCIDHRFIDLEPMVAQHG